MSGKSRTAKARYRAVVGLDYVDTNTGKEVRVEPGKEVKNMNEVSIKNELTAGNLELWNNSADKKAGE